MSLQIWLPFTKDLRNLGTQDTEITNSGATFDTNGKIGGCYSFNGSAYLKGTQNFISNDTTDWTFACWMKVNSTSSATGQTLFSCRSVVSSSGITIFYYGSQWYIDDGARWQFTPTITIAQDTWYHVCIVRKSSGGKGKYLYINGVLDSSTSTIATPTTVNTTSYSIGMCQSNATAVSGNPLNGYLNDVRFYNHALSVAEIKEISKGLIYHYKLDDFYSSDNLIVNGFGELGDENWQDATKISTTEIPSNHSEIKASFYGGNATKQYIPIIKNHSYTITGYVKAMENQTGNKYPSIYPYDIDKKFIEYHMSEGINSAYATTLAQPLHKGDTVIYATDLSNWTTANNNHYFYVAIFGYRNSFGEVYPDLIYTQDAPKFGTYDDKSHIDKTNNTITLNSAFTGEDRPAGTTICQSTQGSTYYYPWGGIAVTSVTDWTFKTHTFKPASSRRLRCAEYIKWSTLGGLYIAGNKLVDNNAVDTKVVDSSGYGNHGIKNGGLSISTSTARHSLSTVFNGTDSFIEADPLPAETMSISLWLKTSWVTPSEYQLAVHDIQSGLGIGWIGNRLITNTDKNGPCVDMTATNYTANIWNHIVVVNRGNSTHDVYVNGVLAPTTAKDYWLGDLTKLNIGVRHKNGSYVGYFEGQLSDFRAYATALSTDDVLALYNVGAKVAKTGVLLGYEMKEG